MQYLGGKAALVKELGPLLTTLSAGASAFYDVFCGAANVVAAVQHPNRFANDAHPELVALLQAVQRGWQPPHELSEDLYRVLKHTELDCPEWRALRGFAGFGCSFGGMWFSTYARSARGGGDRNYARAAANSLARKAPGLAGVSISLGDYRGVHITQGSVVYCDPPYAGTTGYSVGSFDYAAFLAWANQTAKHSLVVISEYARNVPDGARVIWSRSARRGLRGTSDTRTEEVLYVL